MQTVAQSISIQKWRYQIPQLQEQYSLEKPFPHIVFDNFFDEDIVNRICEDFPTDIENKGWIHWQHFNENKHGLNNPDLLSDSIRKVIDFLNGQEFISFLEKLTGIPQLIADPSLEGGGLHVSRRGGYLNMHADFSTHPKIKTLHRRLNAILYLNKDWLPEYKGDLEFWSKDMKHCEKKVAPLFNRLVIFNTNHESFHGFPEPLNCPPHEVRKSLALYYYTQSDGENTVVSTNYRTRPGDGLKAIPNWIDNKLLFVYTLLKRKLKIGDDFASKILGARSRNKKNE